MRPVLSAILAAAALAAPFSQAVAQPSNDGTWAVTLVTQKGDCDRTLSSSIRVVDGRVDERGLFAQIKGAIDDNGKVALRVERGGDHVIARGAVSGQQARGVWTAPGRNCEGAWVAMRS